MRVKPLAMTQVDWMSYIEYGQKVTGTSPMHALDACAMKPDSLAGWLASLSKEAPREALRNDDLILQHAMASFMVEAEVVETCDIMLADLRVCGSGHFFIISGNLLEWKQAIIWLCKKSSSNEVRFIMNSCLLYFEKAELGELFANYRKVTLPDDTFILERK